MKHASRAADARHLQRLRKVTNWPLGENGFYGRIEWLLMRPALPDGDDQIHFASLVESLADLYGIVHAKFDEFRPPFDPMDWHRPRHTKAVRQAARFHFNELLTTTRFAVEDLANSGEIIAHKFGTPAPLNQEHSIALAALVCVKTCLETLEQTTLRPDDEVGHLLIEATKSRDQAATWLAHFVTAQSLRNKRANQARQAAKKLRTSLTAEQVAKYIRNNPGKPQKAIVLELAKDNKVSERTVSTRLKEAKTLNLLQ